MEEEPSAKRLKRNDDDYLPGNITMIELHNFMTFDHVICTTSLVCAIALGLGGEPQLLGRASKVGAYVKRGETSGESITTTRIINTKTKSEWLFNDDVVAKSEVLEIIQKFNIQVNNLTQFLPQDRVCEFAKLTPVQLLEETEKAVGDPQLPVLHSTLVNRSSEHKRLEVVIQHSRDALNRLKVLNVAQQEDVERVLYGKELLVQVESMKKNEYMNVKKDETAAVRRKEKAVEQLTILQGPIEEQRKALAAQDEVCENVSNKQYEAHLLGVKVRGKYDEMEELRMDNESRQQRIETANEKLADAIQALKNLPGYDYESHMAERDLLGTQIVELINSAKEKRRRIRNMTIISLCNLKRSGADKIYEAYRWLQEHRHELKTEVYGPILLEVTVPNKDRSFVTQDADDRDILVEGLKQFNVPVLNYAGGRAGNDRVPFELSEEMQKLGIYSRLDQLFDGPNAVKEVLAGRPCPPTRISDLRTPENHYRWKKSRYGGHVSASVDSISPSRLFLCSADAGEIQKLRSSKRELEY
ncbi:hypothetical protein MKX01_013067 [Papaver californicum]|nr:hypothetical protein MKX01_013067 [Papaver californicum]